METGETNAEHGETSRLHNVHTAYLSEIIGLKSMTRSGTFGRKVGHPAKNSEFEEK